MSDLDRRVSGDWIDVREAAQDFYGLNDYFELSPAAMLAERQSLTLANEEGITEYKRSRLLPVFDALENMLYKALTQEELERQTGNLHLLLFVTMLERCVVLGTVGLVRGPESGAPDLDVDLKLVLGDVQERVKREPALLAHPAVKNILVQMKRYQTEMAKMKELQPKIKEDARQTFLSNFKETFASIADSIKKNYADLLKELRAGEPQTHTSLARRMPLKPLAPLLTQQAMTFAKMRSSVLHATEEKFRTRELLGRLFHQKGQILELMEAELRAYGALCREQLGTGDAATAVELSKSLAIELAGILERQARIDQT
jgi:hypothetical protein